MTSIRILFSSLTPVSWDFLSMSRGICEGFVSFRQPYNEVSVCEMGHTLWLYSRIGYQISDLISTNKVITQCALAALGIYHLSFLWKMRSYGVTSQVTYDQNLNKCPHRRAPSLDDPSVKTNVEKVLATNQKLKNLIRTVDLAFTLLDLRQRQPQTIIKLAAIGFNELFCCNIHLIPEFDRPIFEKISLCFYRYLAPLSNGYLVYQDVLSHAYSQAFNTGNYRRLSEAGIHLYNFFLFLS